MFCLIRQQAVRACRPTLFATHRGLPLAVRGYKTPTIDWTPVRSRSAPRRTSGKIFLSLLVLMPVTLFCLGVWQIQRLEWKRTLLNECEARLAAPVITLPERVDPEAANLMEYRRVRVTGTFDYDHEMFVGPVPRGNDKGYLLVCPLVRPNGDRVLVQRGWIRADRVHPDSRQMSGLSRPAGEVTVECFLRKPYLRLRFQHAHEAGSRLYTYLDYESMWKTSNTLPMYLQAVYNMEVAGTAGVHDPTTDYTESQFTSWGVPIGKNVSVEYSNNHLNYIVTWFGVCIASSIMLVVLMRGRRGTFQKDKLRHAQKLQY